MVIFFCDFLDFQILVGDRSGLFVNICHRQGETGWGFNGVESWNVEINSVVVVGDSELGADAAGEQREHFGPKQGLRYFGYSSDICESLPVQGLRYFDNS